MKNRRRHSGYHLRCYRTRLYYLNEKSIVTYKYYLCPKLCICFRIWCVLPVNGDTSTRVTQPNRGQGQWASTLTSETACLPLTSKLATPIISLSLLLHSNFSPKVSCRIILPFNSARYLLVTLRSEKNVVRAVKAGLLLATTTSPPVPATRRLKHNHIESANCYYFNLCLIYERIVAVAKELNYPHSHQVHLRIQK